MYACQHGTYVCLFVLINNWMIPHDWWQRMIRMTTPCSCALPLCASLVGAMLMPALGNFCFGVFLMNWSPPRIGAPHFQFFFLVGAPIREWCVCKAVLHANFGLAGVGSRFIARNGTMWAREAPKWPKIIQSGSVQLFDRS